jgi:hypothetical protein
MFGGLLGHGAYTGFFQLVSLHCAIRGKRLLLRLSVRRF